MKDVTIIGGGMAGLAAAYYFQQINPGASWQLFEERERLGGKIVTHRERGFIIEGGPDSFITQKPWGLELCKALNLTDRLMPCNEKLQKVYILQRGRLVPLPVGFRLAVPTKIKPFLASPLFSWPAKARMMLEPWIPANTSTEDESVQSFIQRRFGREAAAKIAGPIMAGIYVADPSRLSIMATFPMFRAMETKYGSLMKAMRNAPRPASPPMPMFMSFQNGMGEWVDALTHVLIGDIQRNQQVQSMAFENEHWRLTMADGSVTASKNVILAAPPHDAARLLKPVHPEAADALNRIRAVSTATVSLGFRAQALPASRPLDGFGFVAPAREQCPFLACTWSSSKFNARAPDNHILLRVFWGGEGKDALVQESDIALVDRTRAALKTILGIHEEPVISYVSRWIGGNPQYDVGHAARMNQLFEQAHTLPHFALAGSGYQGIGLPDCIHSGKSAAERVSNRTF